MSKPIWCKITNEKEIHNGFQYKDGLNKLEDKFDDDSKKSCCKGGLYFTTIEHVSDFVFYGCNLRIVELPEDDPEFKMIKDPHHEPPKWRANMLVLKDKYDLYDIKTIQKFNIDTAKLINDLFLKHKYDIIIKLWGLGCKSDLYVNCNDGYTIKFYTYLEWATKFNRIDGLTRIYDYFTSKKLVPHISPELFASHKRIIKYCAQHMGSYIWWKKRESQYPNIEGELYNDKYLKIFKKTAVD